MNEYLVTAAVHRGPRFNEHDDEAITVLHAPPPMNIAADVRAQRLRTQQVQVEVLFDFRTRHATVTRNDFYANENWLYELLTSLVPFGQWERVVVRATADPGENAIDGGPYADRILFDRTAMQNEHGHLWPVLTLEHMMQDANTGLPGLLAHDLFNAFVSFSSLRSVLGLLQREILRSRRGSSVPEFPSL
jgi:hypothetical protein